MLEQQDDPVDEFIDQANEDRAKWILAEIRRRKQERLSVPKWSWLKEGF